MSSKLLNSTKTMACEKVGVRGLTPPELLRNRELRNEISILPHEEELVCSPLLLIIGCTATSVHTYLITECFRASVNFPPNYKPSERKPAMARRAFVRTINFKIIPPTGTMLMLQDQKYLMVGSRLYDKSDGTRVPLLIWETRCPECDVVFECQTRLKEAWPTRRCQKHRKPGLAVKKRRKRGDSRKT